MNYQLITTHLRENITKATLDNGLQIFVHPKPGYHSKYAIFATKYGSIDNDFVDRDGLRHQVPNGIAHFLEHKMFEEPEGNVFNDFSSLGVSVNAFTNYNMTAYLFSGTKNFYPALKRLIDFVQSPHFTEKNVQKEQGIIQQEIKMYDDHAGWVLQRNLLECLYREHPIRIDIAGTVDSIEKITKDMLYTCYSTFYHPSNMVLYVVGDLNPQQVIEAVNQNQLKKSFSLQPEIKRFYPAETREVNCAFKEGKMPIAVPIMALGLKDVPLNRSGDSLHRREIISNLVNHLVLGKSSILFNKLYEQGLLTEQFSIGYSGTTNYAYTLLGGPTPKPNELCKYLLEGWENAKTRGISAADLARAKRTFIGLYTISYDNLSMIANRYISYYLKGIDFNNYPEIINSITIDQVNSRLQEINLDNRALSVMLPS